MRTFASTSLFVLLAACGGGGSDAGSGSDTLLVDADISASPEVSNASEVTDFTTEIDVRVRLDGVDVRTGTVEVESEGGNLSLIFDADTGEWRGVQAGYFEVYRLDVTSGDHYVHGVELDGPDIHVFASPDGSSAVDSTQPLLVEWDRDDEADAASIETREMDEVAIPDTGEFELPADTLRSNQDQTEDDEIRLMRRARIVPAGAVGGSELRVEIENRIELLVAATGP